jgi:carbon storage regulator
MLVINRRIGEAVVLDKTIRITVFEIDGGGRVKLGIEAPPSVIVLREELLREAEHQKQQAHESEVG